MTKIPMLASASSNIDIVDARHPEENPQLDDIMEATPPGEIPQTQPLDQVLNQDMPVYPSIPSSPPPPAMSSSPGSSYANTLSYPDISQASRVLRSPPPVPERSIDSVRTTPAILLAGLTGSGKSTLISHLTNAPVRIGHDLSSCTREITTYQVNISGQAVRLIDTPGFDDTDRSDSDILSVIGLTLAKIYEERIPLLGVVYLHRISDPRVGGASRKSVRILEGIVGPQAFGSVLLATTMWDKVTLAEGEKRERELVSNPEFFGKIYNRGQTPGAMVQRHTGTRDSAQGIMKDFISRQHSLGQMQTVLLIQHQLVVEKLSLEETTAGKIVDDGLRQQQAKQQEELKELEVSLKECRDGSVLSQLKDEHQAQLARVQELSVSRQALKGSYQQLAERLIPPLSAEMENIAKEDSVAISEIIVLKGELNNLRNQLQSAKDNQVEQEITLLEMKEEQRHQKHKTQTEQRKLMALLEKQLAEKQELLAKRERREQRRLQKAARNEHRHSRIQQHPSWLTWFAGPGYSIC